MSFRIPLGFVFALLAVIALPAPAQTYPNRPVRIVYGYAPGGADAPARLLSQALTESMKQSFIIDYKPGADGMLGSDTVAKSSADGYTLGWVTAGHAINSILHAKSIPYHPVRDFTPISLVADSAQVLLINPTLPATDLKSLIALAKARPGQLNFASGGTGGPSHLSGEILNWEAGINIVHVPYKGGGPAIAAVLANDVPMTWIGAAAAMPQIKAGKLKALAVTTAKRSTSLPDVPTVMESGFPNYEVSAYYGIVGPAGLPAAIVGKVNSEIVRYVQQRDTREKFAGLGVDAVGSAPEVLGERWRVEIVRWEPIIKKSGVTID